LEPSIFPERSTRRMRSVLAVIHHAGERPKFSESFFAIFQVTDRRPVMRWETIPGVIPTMPAI
jgi:hypothetical protein